MNFVFFVAKNQTFSQRLPFLLERSAASTKRIVLNPPKGSSIVNYGTIINDGLIVPATIAINDDGSFGSISMPGRNADMFVIENSGTIINSGYIYGQNVDERFGEVYAMAEPFMLIHIPVFALDNGTELVPTVDADGNYNYDLNVQGFALRFTLNAEAVGQLRARLA